LDARRAGSLGDGALTADARSREPLPFTLITGFLGAGKTTLLNRLLGARSGLRLGVLQNERGLAGLDAPPAARARVEIAEGCACCVRNPDLVQAARDLAARGDLDRVLFETSGLADPLPLGWTLGRPDLRDLVRLDAVVAVVDCLNPSMRAVPEWAAQVAGADLVVLTKGEEAGEIAVHRTLKEVRSQNPRARCLASFRSRVPGLVPAMSDGDALPQLVLDLKATPPGEPPEPHEAQHSAFATVSFAGPERYRLDAIETALEALPPPVFRAKGIVRLEGGGYLRFGAVGGRLDVDPDVPPPDHGESRFVFLGPGLRREDIEPLLAGARLSTGPTRPA
jgi:G3E family GTPase